MPIFNVGCRYESSRTKTADFTETVEAPDRYMAIEIVCDKVRTAEHFVIVSVERVEAANER